MTPPDATLATLLERAEGDRDAVAARLRQAQGIADRLERQGRQLAEYRDDYRRRAPGHGPGSTSTVDLLRVHRDFMHRLEQALEHHAAQKAAAERELHAVREALVAAEQRVAAVGKLMERRVAERRRGAERLEQRRSDELAQRLGWSRRGIAVGD